MHYRIRHLTEYDYDSDVLHSYQLLHLVPRPAPYQQCLEHQVTIAPVPLVRREELDAFGNPVIRVELEHPHRRLTVASEMTIAVHPRAFVPAAQSAPWERVAAALAWSGREPAREDLQAGRFRCESPLVRIKRVFGDYAAECFAPGRPVLECADALMSKLHREFTYAPGETHVATPLSEVLQRRRGVCQDFSHLMIACLRARGLAARYVSGYVRSASALRGAGASHAWLALYAPPFGWVELDPTNHTRVTSDHVALAWGRDFGDVSPLRGVILGGSTHRLAVSVQLESGPA